MSFIDLTIKSEYRNQLINVVEAFYTPVLQQSVLYCRSVGFFSSSSLVRLSYGLSSLYKNQYESKVVKYHTKVERNVSVKRRKRY